MNFQNWFIVFYFRWFFQRIQRINEINETNSTNQRIKFSLILQNFNEFSTNQRKFQRINENSRKIFEFVEILFEIGRCFENCDWLVGSLVDWLEFSLRIRQNFYKSTKILSVDSLNSLTNFQINIYSLISFFKSTKSKFSSENESIFFGALDMI